MSYKKNIPIPESVDNWK